MSHQTLLDHEENATTTNSSTSTAETILSGAVAATWLSMAAGMPFFNKATFKYLPHGVPQATLTPTIIQMMGSSAFLILIECIRHLVVKYRKPNSSESWLFGPGFVQKALHLLLPSLFYGALMALTNSSLSMTSVNFHVLLKMTVIVWVVLFAWLLQGERPSIITILCCVGLIVGTILVSWSYDSPWDDTPEAISLTLASALAQALMVVLLRRAITRLPKNLGFLEVTAFKMTVATLLLLPVALGLDSKGWDRLMHAEPKYHTLVSCGIFVTTMFQTTHVIIQVLALATSVGILQMCTIIPQEIISLSTGNPKPTWDALHISGYILTPAVAVVYVIYRLYVVYEAKKQKEQSVRSTIN